MEGSKARRPRDYEELPAYIKKPSSRKALRPYSTQPPVEIANIDLRVVSKRVHNTDQSIEGTNKREHRYVTNVAKCLKRRIHSYICTDISLKRANTNVDVRSQQMNRQHSMFGTPETGPKFEG
jgi:hypothetical protein